MSLTSRPILALAAALTMTLAACGGGSDDAAPESTTAPAAATQTTDAVMSDDEKMAEDQAMAEDEKMAEEEKMADEDAMAEVAAWQTLEIIDVDGATFTITDLVGTPVFVENFATWCPNCREQLAKTNEAAGELGEEAIFLALSVETELDPADVVAYAEENGFDNIRFAVMSAEMLAAFSESFGNSAVNPPSTPHVVVDAMGHAGELITGFEEPAAIVASLSHDGQ